MSTHSPTSSVDSHSHHNKHHVSEKHQQQLENPSKDGWVNRHATTSATVPINSSTQFHWRLTRAVLKDGSLNIYKPPSDVSVRSFDPMLKKQQPQQPEPPLSASSSTTTFRNSVSTQGGLSASGAATGTTASTPTATTHKRIMSGSTTSASLSTMPRSRDSSTTALRIQYRGISPHPDLEYDGRGRIIGGSDEAICHTVLFGDSDEFATTAVQLMPLLSDIISMLEILTEFSASALGARSTATGAVKNSVILRLKLVVETVLDKFPGMLLDSTIMAALMHLLETLSAHDDPLGNDLKKSVFEKQKSMTDILSYSTHQEPILWSVQPRLQDKITERLRAFMNRVETTQAGSGTHSSAQYPKPISTVPPEIFLDVTMEAWSAQIYYFHLAFSRDWSPTNDISLLFGTRYQYHRHSPLVFDSTNIHFLGRLLLDHLFGSNRRLESSYRGRLIKHWIDLGNELKGCGDMVGWLAIATVLCSIPVMRLRDAWSHVSNELRERVVKEWAPVVFDLERRLMIADMSKKSTYHVLAPQGIGVSYPKERVVPFFGDLCVKFEEGSTYRQCEGRLNRIRTAFQKWDDYLENIPQNDTFDPPPVPVPAIQKLLYALLKNHYESPMPTPDQVLQMSLNAEPAGGGHYLKYHYVHRSPLVTGAYLPLIFTETNPHYKLFTKSSLIAASGVQNGSSKRSKRNDSQIQYSLGSYSNLNSMRHGSTSGQSVASNASSNSSTTSLQHSYSMTVGPGNAAASNSALHRSNSFPPAFRQSQQATTTGVMDVDFSSREFVIKHSSRHVLMKNVRDVLNVGTRLYNLGNDIIVKSFEDDAGSRPSSVIETPSRRHSSQSRPLSASQMNPSSVSPRSSAALDRNSLTRVWDRSINVVVRAANLERLVDILVLGINQFNHFLNPEDFEDCEHPDFKPPQLKIDMDANTLTFFATFRSFCSPMDLLESLRKRFLGAQSAALAIVEVNKKPLYERKGDDDNNNGGFDSQESLDNAGFPNWDGICDEGVERIPWKTVAQIQMGVLEACHLWVTQYFGDFVNDLQVRDGFLDLLKVFEKELEIWKEPSAWKDEYKTYLKSIETLHKKVRKLFIKKSYRPNDVKVHIPKPSGVSNKAESLLISGTNSQYHIEEFVENMNEVVSGYFSLIQLTDWIELFEILEVQSADPMGFFNYHSPPYNNEDDLVIQDIFTYLETLYRESTDDKVIKLFPHPVQELFKLHQNIVNYVTSQVCDPLLHKDDRVAKMTTVLKALGIMKTRMKSLDLFPSDEPAEGPADNSGNATTVPGFLESAFVQAVIRPESRMFANSWLQASRELSRHYGSAVTFNGNMTTLDPYIPIIPVEDLKHTASQQPLVPCIGWTVERMLEIVCYVPNLSLENNTLINFDKRRYIYNFITNVMDLKDDQNSILDLTPESPFLKKMAFLINPDKNLYHIDRRNVRDAAVKEAKEFSRSSVKNRVFISYTAGEMEKLKRDARQHELVERQVREQKRHRSKPSSTSGSMNEKKSRSRFGGLLKAVRPISMAFSGSFSATQSDKVVTPWDLPNVHNIADGKCKPMVSIDLGESEIASLRAMRLPHLFKVTSCGTDHVFQATSEGDAEEWVQFLHQGRKYAKVMSQIQPTSTKVFGVPVSVVCEREQRNIPKVVDTLLSEIEARGLEEIGLYRVPGSLASVNALKAAFDAGEEVDMEDERWYDINTVGGCFKLYLRELPETLFTVELFDDFLTAGSSNDIKRLRSIAYKLPSCNFYLLKRVFEHLALVASHGSANKMHAVNLAIVFSMSFLPRTSNNSSVSNDLGAMQNIMKCMIASHTAIFADSVVDSDSSDEAEYSDPRGESGGASDEKENQSSRPHPNQFDDANEETGEQNNKTLDNAESTVPTDNGDDVHEIKRDSFTQVSAY